MKPFLTSDKFWQFTGNHNLTYTPWCRRCSVCSGIVRHYGPGARQAAMAAVRNNNRCMTCAHMKGYAKRRKQVVVNRIGNSPISKVIDVAEPYDVRNRYHLCLWFRKVTCSCGICGNEKVQTVPVVFKDMNYYCEKCNERQLIQFE